MRLWSAGRNQIRCTTVVARKRRSRTAALPVPDYELLILAMPSQRIIIDTDPGVDDALAFLLALASPEIKLEALTTTQGNVTLEKATSNALSVLELGRASHIPVVQGSVLPLV